MAGGVKPRVVTVGGGLGGVTAARHLDRRAAGERAEVMQDAATTSS